MGIAVGVVVADGVLVAVGVAVVVVVAVPVGVLVAVVGVLVGVAVGVLVAVGVTVGVLVGVAVGVLVAVGVAVGVLVGVAVGMLVDVAVGVLVAVGVAVGVLVAVVLVAVGVAVGVVVAGASSSGPFGGFSTFGRLVNATTLSPTLIASIPASESGSPFSTVSLVTFTSTVPCRVLIVIDELPTESTVPEIVLRVSCPAGTWLNGAASVRETSWVSGPPTTDKTSRPATSGLTPSEIVALNHSLMAIPLLLFRRLEGHDEDLGFFLAAGHTREHLDQIGTLNEVHGCLESAVLVHL